MGAVYRARIVRNARPVAIKVLRAEIVGQDQFETGFEAEVLVTSRIKHENIVEVLEHIAKEPAIDPVASAKVIDRLASIEDATLWIVDDPDADLEGRRIQELIESFTVIE